MKKEIWEKFCSETPEFGKVGTPERILGDEIFRKEYLDLVDTGKMDYQTALERTRDDVDRRLGFNEVEALRRNRVMGRPPQFEGPGLKPEPKGGTSAGSPRDFRG